MLVARRTLMLAAAALAGGSLLPRAAAAAGGGAADVAPGGTLRVAVAISSLGGPYWTARDTDGSLHGIPVTLGRELARRLGIPVRFVVYHNSGQITDAGERNEWDVAFLPVDAERARRLAFGPIYNASDATFIVRAGSTAQSFADLDRPGTKIAAVAGTTTMRGAQRVLTNVTVTGYENADEIVTLLRAGEIDAFANLRDQLVPLAHTIAGARVLPGAYQQTKNAVAVPLGRPAALAEVTAFMNDVKTNGFLRAAFDAQGMHELPIAP